MSEAPILPSKIVEIRRIQAMHRALNAARSLFDTHGWYGVTVKDIAKKADVDIATISAYFPTKQTVALAAYSRLLQPIVRDAEQAVTRPWPACNPTGFIRDLAKLLIERPALAVALLPVSSEYTKTDSATTAKIVIVDFDQLAQLFGSLVKSLWKGESTSGCDLAEAAEMALSGLLSWILTHPDRSFEDASRLVLNQFL